MKLVICNLLAIMTLFVAACSPQATPTPTPIPPTEVPTTTLKVSGSGSVTPILNAIADKFEAANPSYIIEVLPGSGTGGGVRGIDEGTLDFAAMSRPPREGEAEQEVEFIQFGSSFTAVMTHPDVGVTELTSEQLADILTGKITNWSDVGGDDMEIIVYLRDPDEGNTKDVRAAFIGDVEFVDSAQVLDSQTDMQNTLSNVEGAIGYGTWVTALANDADVVSLTIDGIGVDNTPEEFYTVMGIGYLSDRSDDIQTLVDWLLSDDGQVALEDVGVIVNTSE